MNAAGPDVSKGKNMVAIMRPFGDVAAPHLEVGHITSELAALAEQLQSPEGGTRIVM